MLIIHKARILRIRPLEKTCLDFKKWVKSIKPPGYNGERRYIERGLKKLHVAKKDNAMQLNHVKLSYSAKNPCNFKPFCSDIN